MKKTRKPKETPTKLTDDAAAKRYGVSERTVRRWRRDGAPLDDPKAMGEWLAQRRQLPPGAVPGLAEAKLAEVEERVRRLRLANDQTEGRLVSRAWVCERIQRMCAELTSLEHESLSNHPLQLAKAGCDVAAAREALRETWGSIRDMVSGLAIHLKEGDE